MLVGKTSAMQSLCPGIYDALLDHDLRSILKRHPELRSVFGKLDQEAPPRYSSFLGKAWEKPLRCKEDTVSQLKICNEIIDSS